VRDKRDDAGHTLMSLMEGKQVVAFPCAPFDLGRIVRGLQIVADGDDGQENCGERGKLDELQCNGGKRRNSGRVGSSAPPANEPAAPKGDDDSRPSEIAKQFHRP